MTSLRATRLLTAILLLTLLPIARSQGTNGAPRQDAADLTVLKHEVDEARKADDGIKQQMRDDKANIERQMDAVKAELEKKMLMYVGFVVVFVTSIGGLLTFLGWNAVKKWAKDTVSKKLEPIVADAATRLDALSDAKREQFDKELQQAADARLRIEESDREASELVDALKKREGIAGPLPKPEKAKIQSVRDDIMRVKSEKDYTANDWFVIGLSAGTAGDNETAVRAFTKVIELDPDNATAFYNKGLANSLMHNYEAAILDFSEGIRLNPENAKILRNRGVAYARSGEYATAVADFTKALELEPGETTAIHWLCESLIILGDYGRALSVAETFSQTEHTEASHKLANLYLRAIAQKLIGRDTTQTEAELDGLLAAGTRMPDWSFAEIEEWLATAELTADKKQFITDLITKLRATLPGTDAARFSA